MSATKKKAEPGSQMSPVSDQMPAYLQDQQGGNRGRENVGVDDLVIPRLEIVQDLSPARKKQDPNYIEGAEEGMLYNNVTRELYGASVVVVPVAYIKEWLLWKDRKQGGGFGGAYPSAEEAEAARDAMVDEKGKPDSDNWEVVDTGQQFCLLVKPDGSVEEIVVSMAKSKAKVSRKWNSLIRIANGDSFSRAYKLSAVSETNRQNQPYYNFSVSQAGFPAERVYRRAEAMYEQFASGKVRADRSQDDTGADRDEGGEY